MKNTSNTSNNSCFVIWWGFGSCSFMLSSVHGHFAREMVCYYIRQRSWANVMYSSPFVCLFVCLLAGLLKKLWTDLNEI